MLFLVFQIGTERYALEASRIVEVVPLLAVKTIPGAPQGFAGIINYRGRPVAAIDLRQLTSGEPASEWLSTRIIIVKYSDDRGGEHLVGLIAEQATQMLRKDPGEFADTGLRYAGAPYLGPILLDEAGAIQWIKSEQLLSDSFRQLIFSDSAQLAHDSN